MDRPIELLANEVSQNITVTVKFKDYHGWIIRLKIAAFFVWIACLIAGTNFEVEE